MEFGGYTVFGKLFAEPFEKEGVTALLSGNRDFILLDGSQTKKFQYS